MKIVRFDRNEAFLNEELTGLIKTLDEDIDDNPVVAYVRISRESCHRFHAKAATDFI